MWLTTHDMHAASSSSVLRMKAMETIATPTTEAEIADVVREARSRSQSIEIRGGGTVARSDGRCRRAHP